MAPSYPGRDPNSMGRMRPHQDQSPTTGQGASEFHRQEPTFIIGNKAFFLAVKRALDISGGFHVVGAFGMADLQTSLRRSKSLGQTPRVAVIHEPPGDRAEADDAAHGVLQMYPGCGIVLISGDELEAETERKLEVHDYSALVMPESVIKNPATLARCMHDAIHEAGNAQRIA